MSDKCGAVLSAILPQPGRARHPGHTVAAPVAPAAAVWGLRRRVQGAGRATAGRAACGGRPPAQPGGAHHELRYARRQDIPKPKGALGRTDDDRRDSGRSTAMRQPVRRRDGVQGAVGALGPQQGPTLSPVRRIAEDPHAPPPQRRILDRTAAARRSASSRAASKAAPRLASSAANRCPAIDRLQGPVGTQPWQERAPGPPSQDRLPGTTPHTAPGRPPPRPPPAPGPPPAAASPPPCARSARSRAAPTRAREHRDGKRAASPGLRPARPPLPRGNAARGRRNGGTTGMAWKAWTRAPSQERLWKTTNSSVSSKRTAGRAWSSRSRTARSASANARS